MEIEQYMYDAYRRTEERVNQLKRALDADMLTEAIIRIIFDWPAPAKVEEKQPEPAPAPVQTVAQAAKPMTSKKAEMMARVKQMHLKGMTGRQIAEKTGLSEGTVSTYKKEMGLIGVCSLSDVNAPGLHGGATEVG